MKTLYLLGVILTVALLGCTKASVDPMAAGGWQLLQKQSSILNTGLITTYHSADSSVTLQLNTDGSYISNLSGQLVSKGSYSITTDTSYNNAQILQLNNFNTTGLFSIFVTVEIGSNGQEISSYDGMVMKTSNDTLTLSSPFTPDGYELYTFVKK